MAKLSLAQIYAAQGKQAEGEKLIQSVIDHPTELVSKESATIALARLVAPTDLPRARKMLEPLRGNARRRHQPRRAHRARRNFPKEVIAPATALCAFRWRKAADGAIRNFRILTASSSSAIAIA